MDIRILELKKAIDEIDKLFNSQMNKMRNMPHDPHRQGIKDGLLIASVIVKSYVGTLTESEGENE